MFSHAVLCEAAAQMHKSRKHGVASFSQHFLGAVNCPAKRDQTAATFRHTMHKKLQTAQVLPLYKLQYFHVGLLRIRSRWHVDYSLLVLSGGCCSGENIKGAKTMSSSATIGFQEEW